MKNLNFFNVESAKYSRPGQVDLDCKPVNQVKKAKKLNKIPSFLFCNNVQNSWRHHSPPLLFKRPQCALEREMGNNFC